MSEVFNPAVDNSGEPAVTDRVPVGSDMYNRIVEFLYDEAALLDNLQLNEWAKCFTEDIVYQAPVKVTHTRSDKKKKGRPMMHLFENHESMMLRIFRIEDTNVAWAEEPSSRTRRLITNVIVHKTERENEYDVTSYFLVTRNRFEQHDYQLMSGKRMDRWRLVDGELKLARRIIDLDMSVLSMPNLAIFF
jgi:3-phenylpropionate/cinnamic acid dioxygenase small subunit